jgi:hypothetical protein
VIRIFFGFFLGCIFTFYSYPLVQTVMTQVGLVEEKARSTLEVKEPAYTLNPNPPISLVRDKKYEASIKEADELKNIMKAVSISNTAPEHGKAPDFVVNVIRDFVKMNPHLGFYVRERIDGGLNNKEALEIINKYVSER